MQVNRNQFTLEVTTTALCNLNCTYCFEGVKTNTQRLDGKVDVLKTRIAEFYNSDFFKNTYDVLNISFWGGEPTLNGSIIVELMKEFQEYENISFHIYTNAYDRKRLAQIIDNVDYKKLSIQVSYDGSPINDKFRITHAGAPSTKQVISNLKWLVEKGVTVSLKATIPFNSMKTLHACWKDYEKLYDELSLLGPNVTVAYAPTIDYSDNVPKDKIIQEIELFREQMLKIAYEEIQFFKKHNRHLCTWFTADSSKQHCSAGVHMHAIDVDGKSYACHGSLYSPNKEKMNGSSIDDDNLSTKIAEMSSLYAPSTQTMPDICNNCIATTCMICPVASLDASKKENYFDQWTDRWATNMCGFFKTFGEIDRTVQAYLRNELEIKK